MMRRDSRLVLGIGALLLLPAFWLPLWSIKIVAPQYRDGLGMYIGLRDLWGHSQHDIQNINILNHYIGMKPIDPETVGVLSVMPWVVGFLIVTGLLTALIGRRWLVASWLVAFAVLGTAGLYEFWSWNYDYGHNLDPMAPIKVPGMTYQPPLFGTKQLLNMSTSSYPWTGTAFIALSFASAIAALVLDRRSFAGGGTPAARLAQRGRGDGGRAAAALVALLALGTAACGRQDASADVRREAPEFAAGVPCAYCDGVIPEERFGAELVTASGETFRFMSVECLAGFVVEQRVAPASIAALRVVDFNHGERLLEATAAYYVRMAWVESPSGLNIAAVETERIAANLHYFLGGERMTWEEVLELVRSEWKLAEA
jgi:copper chaperone NosL